MAHSLHLCIGLLVLLVASFCCAAAEEKQQDNATTSPAPAKETKGAEQVLGKMLDAMLVKSGELSVDAVKALRGLIIKTEATEKMDGVIRGEGFHTLDVSAARGRFHDVPADFLIKQLATAKLFPDCTDNSARSYRTSFRHR